MKMSLAKSLSGEITLTIPPNSVTVFLQRNSIPAFLSVSPPFIPCHHIHKSQVACKTKLKALTLFCDFPKTFLCLFFLILYPTQTRAKHAQLQVRLGTMDGGEVGEMLAFDQKKISQIFKKDCSCFAETWNHRKGFQRAPQSMVKKIYFPNSVLQL